METIYDFSVTDADSNPYRLSQFKGKVIIIVNTASLCGFTPQYKQLEALYKKYDDLVILAFPCNQFAREDPDPIGDIISNIRTQFGVTYPILNKITVNGSECDPLFKYLKDKMPGKLGFKGVFWNFEKFVVDKRGNVVGRFPSEISPMSLEPLVRKLSQ